MSQTYNFTPHELTNEQQQALYPKLDKFFEFVTKNKEKYLDQLREELKRNDNNPYFYYDGGILLFEISQSDSDIQLVADALVKVDLRDISPEIYLKQILRLSLKGANVIDAALHIFDDPNFQVYIPQHALTLKYGEALQFILPRYSSDLYIEKLVSIFNSINSADNKLTCLDLFIHANCCRADDFLTSLINDNQQPQQIRNQIIKNQQLTFVSKSSDERKYLELFEERKSKLSNISDEVLHNLNEYTLEMRKNFECGVK